MLNTALRIQNIESILLFGFFIRDLDEQLRVLQNQQPKTIMKVYRGQWMRKGEVNRLRISTDKLISVNSFLSTSLNLNVALMFLDDGISLDVDREQVLFEIEVDSHILDAKSLTNISMISSYSEEEEILFMINAIFKIKSVKQDNLRTIIQLTLCNDNEHLQNDQNDGQLALGDVLLDMGQLNEADRYYERVLNEFQPNDIYTCYNQRGIIAANLGDYNLSIEYFNKALSDTNFIDSVNVAATYNNMGNAYEELDEIEKALHFFSKALTIYREVYGASHHFNVANCLNNIGNLYANKNEYEEAIKNFKTALEIQEKVCPNNHQDLALSHMNIGNTNADLAQHEKAIEFYDESLKFYKNSVPHDHPELLRLYHNMVRTFEEKNDYPRTLAKLEKIFSLQLESLPMTDSRVLNIQKHIERIKQKTHISLIVHTSLNEETS